MYLTCCIFGDVFAGVFHGDAFDCKGDAFDTKGDAFDLVQRMLIPDVCDVCLAGLEPLEKSLNKLSLQGFADLPDVLALQLLITPVTPNLWCAFSLLRQSCFRLGGSWIDVFDPFHNQYYLVSPFWGTKRPGG